MATTDKYDRQLRLWGANGQRALMEAKILVLGASATASELLKNLVLPGIGRFVLVDGALVTPRDLGRHFFLEKAQLGRPLAEALTELLVEMNSDVAGEARVCDPEKLLATEPEVIDEGWQLVVAAGLEGFALQTLAQRCWDRDVPLMVLRSVGLLGSLRLQLRRHEIVEAKPDAQHWDLRLCDKWPALDAFCRSVDLEALDLRAHKHVPFVVLLSQAMETWRAAHEGKLPGSMAEKNEFKATVRLAARSYSEEDNFQEAVSNAYMAYAAADVDYEVAELAGQARQEPPADAHASNFSFLLAALGDFIAKEGQGRLGPLPGTLPDMTSDTEPYVRLQTIYKTKAEEDRQCLEAHLHRRLEAAGRDTTSVPAEDVAVFCKNVRNLRIVSTSSLADERKEGSTAHHEAILMGSLEPAAPAEQTPIFWYLALRALDDVKALGEAATKEAVWQRLGELKEELQSNGMELGVLSEAHAHEVVRFDGLEPHVTAAIMGGIASQEAVKVVTKQYIPLESTLIYNGIASIMSVLEI